MYDIAIRKSLENGRVWRDSETRMNGSGGREKKSLIFLSIFYNKWSRVLLLPFAPQVFPPLS